MRRRKKRVRVGGDVGVGGRWVGVGVLRGESGEGGGRRWRGGLLRGGVRGVRERREGWVEVEGSRVGGGGRERGVVLEEA
uniref:hypothetical protein n=1 Tax=Corynebacterium glyciniphilum TaxID=1404244 RepID=UPI0011AB41BC